MLNWKRFVSVCLTVAMICNQLPLMSFAYEDEAVHLHIGESGDTWDWAEYTPVSDQEGLSAIADDLNGKYYLTNDIALTSLWEPIDGFRGVLDGNGYTISDVSFNVVEGSYDETYAGLFISNSGTIHNLTVEFAVDLSDCVELHFGGIACSNYGSIVNCNANYRDAKFFSDVQAGAWFEGYVNYCAAVKLIWGREDGSFGPNEPISCAEAARMLLLALGYDADARGYKGTNWDKNVLADAAIVGLLKDYKASTTADVQRQWLAKMIENMLTQCYTFKNTAPDALDVYILFGEKYYKLTKDSLVWKQVYGQ